ncbi:ATP-dependent helicase/deoxyribonuclease subunit B [Marinithermofilum abyssi]|uniref:ATP-dependent helicase/deoxyribonuclease subunit B n=1 Tax=Marinithermofilum abyssi TaxID=1571185 RepID=A0A8J2VFY7_9BACL|nr:PD-(D/E)XK nuclease family protein [Marinithermofilum abyssi]GGE13015.1 ATP-dependent helicase/deoxyribonuclease subunit B [Marinithermofilum abyssi]
MPGTVLLHPPEHAAEGMGLAELLSKGEGRVVYLLPTVRQVTEFRRRSVRWGISGTVRFLTFDQFVLSALPVTQYRRLMTPVEQEWLVRQAAANVLAKEGLEHYREMTDKPGWLKKVEARIGEIKRAGIRPERLDDLWQKQEAPLRELARIYREYQRLLDEEGLLDHEEPYYLLMEAVRKMEVDLPQRVAAEHFPDLSVLQEQLLVQLVTAGVEVSLHLAWDEERPRLFQETEQLINRLRGRGFVSRKLTSSPSGKEKKETLRHLTRWVFHPDAPSCPADDSIEVIAAPGIRREVEEVVARIQAWRRLSRAPISEAAIICPDLDIYRHDLFSVLREAGIPCEREERKRLSRHPLMRTLLHGLSVRAGNESLRPALMESSWLPLGEPEQRGALIRGYRLLGQPRSSEALERRLSRIEQDAFRKQMESEGVPWELLTRLRTLYRWVEAIPFRSTWQEWRDWFRDWAHVLRRPSAWREMARDARMFSLLAEEMSVWEQIKQILDEWEPLFASSRWGETEADLTDFAAALERAAERKEVKMNPGRKGGIRILEPNQVRGERFRAVFVLGCAEGVWPRPIREDWLVSDEERQRLRKEGVRLALSKEQRAHQITPFFQTLVAAKERLVLSYPAVSEEGNRRLPSPYLEELKQVFLPGTLIVSERAVSDVLPPRWEDCPSWSRKTEWAVATLHKPQTKSNSPEERERADAHLAEWFRQNPEGARYLAARVEAERQRWYGKAGKFDGVLSLAVMDDWRERFRSQVWSATQLNELMQCRFHFFAGRMLQALPRKDADEEMTALERGEFMHRVLTRFWKFHRETPLHKIQPEDARDRMLAVLDSVWQEWMTVRGAVDSLVLRVEKARLRQKLLTMLEHEQMWRKKGDHRLRPRHLEFSFGMQVDSTLVQSGEVDGASTSSPAQIPLSETRTIRLRGKVDRIDVNDEGEYVIYDYKSGSAPLTADVHGGAHLQLPLYMWALQESFGFQPDRALGAAFYTPGKRKGGNPPTDNRNQGLWRKAHADKAGISARAGSLLEEGDWVRVQEEIRNSLSRQLDWIEAGNFAVDPARGCPAYCPHQHVCRIDTRRSGKGSPDEEGDQP